MLLLERQRQNPCAPGGGLEAVLDQRTSRGLLLQEENKKLPPRTQDGEDQVGFAVTEKRGRNAEERKVTFKVQVQGLLRPWS